VDGRRTRIVGTTQFDIHVKTRDEIAPGLVRKFSVLKHISLSIPDDNRWRPVFDRYLGEMGDRLRGIDVDPDDVEPNPTGSGRSDDDEDKEPPDETGESVCIHGHVTCLHYDCCGTFEGFTLTDCDREWYLPTGRCSLEEVALIAYRERMKAKVHARKRSDGRLTVEKIVLG